MKQTFIRVLLVEDDPDQAAALREALAHDMSASFQCLQAPRLSEALGQLRQSQFDVGLLSLGLEDSAGLATYEQVHGLAPNLPVIVLAGTWDEQLAIKAVQAGAQDYLVKSPLNRESLSRAIRYAIERQALREAQRASERRFRALIENSTDAIILLSADGRILYVSPSYERVIGSASGKLIGQSALDFLPLENQTSAQALFAKLRQQPHSPLTTEFRYQHRDGSQRWIEVTGNNLLDEPGVEAIVVNFRDISDRMRAEEKLRESEQTFRSFVEQASEGLTLVDEQGTTLEWNQAFEQMTGLPREQALGRPSWELQTELLPPERRTPTRREQLRQLTLQALVGGQSHLFGRAVEVELTRPDGQRRHLQQTIFPITTARGYRLGAVTRDVTEQRRADEQLRKLSRAVEQSPASIVITDPAGRIEYANPKFSQITGYSLAEAIGQNPRLLKSGHTSPEEYRRLWETITTGGEWQGEFHNKKKNGELYWEAANISPVRDERGTITHFLAVKEDITARKQAEAALRQRNRALLTLSAANQALVWAQDEPALLETVCRACVEQAGYRMAWVGYAQPDESRSVRPMAQAGFVDGYLDSANVTWADDERGRGPVGAAIRTGQPRVVRNVASQLDFRPWQAAAAQRGYAAVAALPLVVEGQTVGALTLYSAEPGAFDADELGLLTEVAGDLAYGIQHMRDRAERQRAEAELRASEARFRALIEQAPVAIIVSRNGIALSGNAKFAEIFGPGSAAESAGRVIAELFAPEEREASRERTRRRALGLPVPLQFESVGLRADGTRFPLSVASVQVHLPDGPALMAFISDITERQQAEAALRASEERFRELIRQAPVAISLSRGDLELLSNLKFKAIFGLENGEPASGRSIFEYYAPEVRDERRELSRRMSLGLPVPTEFESIACRSDGVQFPMHVSSVSVQLADGPARLAFVTDITERKQMEAAEREQRRLAEALRDTAEALNSTLDPDELLGRILTNVGRVVPHDAGGIMLAEGGVAHMVQTNATPMIGRAHRPAGYTVPIDELFDLREMVQTGRPVCVSDTLADPRWRNFAEDDWRRSYIGAPIRVREAVIGFIGLDSATPGFFHPKQAADLLAFADQAASALENARLVAKTRRQLREFEVIAQISAAVRISETRPETAQAVVDHMVELLQAEAAALLALDLETGDVVVEYARGLWAGRQPRRPGPQGMLSVPELASSRLYVSQDLKNCAFCLWPETADSLQELVAVPLLARGQVSGILVIGRQTHTNDGEQALLVTIADIAATALLRASLYDQTVRRVNELQALRAIDDTISASLDLRFTLRVLLEQVRHHLGVDAADVLLLNPVLNTLSYAFGLGFLQAGSARLELRLGDGLAGRAALERRLVSVPELAAVPLHPAEAGLRGAEGFVSYYGVPLIAKGQIKGVLNIYQRTPLNPDQDWLDFLETLAGQAALAIDNAVLYEDLQRTNLDLSLAYDTTIEGWSRALDLRDRETAGHTERVTETTLRLARAMGFDETRLVHLRRGALLHDIGKMGIPDEILLKPGPLSEPEWAIMRKHPEYAFQLLTPIAFLRPALAIPYSHHERWDGTGYPRGLRDQMIPLEARIFAVVDVWDALRSDRPYRAAWTEQAARDYIASQAGIHFDPQVVQAFFELERE